ncbi:MAG: XrtA system polysaccharide deacetylase [Chloroflexota bacterium]
MTQYVHQMINALTIDLEDWYQGLTSTGRQVERWSEFEDRVVENTEQLLAVLAAAGVRATFFVLGYVADHFPGLIQQVAAAGHEIGLHGYYHYQATRLTPEQFREDVLAGLQAVEAACGQRLMGYRAPMFSINQRNLWAINVLAELGFVYDSSVFPTRNSLYGFPEAPRFPYRPLPDVAFVEFPLTTLRVAGVNWPVAGGFYLRLLPYPLFRQAIRLLNKEGRPAILYLHPWDLDPDQPRPRPTLRERFTHYYNLRSTAGKLQALLGDFNFGPICELMAGIRGLGD